MTSNAPGGGRILGSLRSADGAGVVRIEDRYDTDINDLWSALTDPGRLARWYGQAEGDLRPGGQFRTYAEADDIESTGRIVACEPPRRLVVTTRETDESWRKGNGVPPGTGKSVIAGSIAYHVSAGGAFSAWDPAHAAAFDRNDGGPGARARRGDGTPSARDPRASRSPRPCHSPTPPAHEDAGARL